mgnify:CR=1 FL=1
MVPDEIVDAAERCTGDDEFFQQIGSWLHDGGDVNDATDEWDFHNMSLLGRSNHPHLTKFLLERGADVNCVNESGMTPLYYACGIPNRGGTDIINMLLDAGANIDAKATEADYGLAIAGETALSTSLDWFRHEDAKTALRYVTLLLRRGASLDDCWGGLDAEDCLRHIEHPEAFADSINDIYDQMDPSMATNEDFIACKKLIADERRRRFVAKRKEVLRLRSLVVRGRAKKSSDAMIEPSFRLPDGVLWNVLSFWPPQRPHLFLPVSTYRPASTYAGPRPGFVFATLGRHTGYWTDTYDGPRPGWEFTTRDGRTGYHLGKLGFTASKELYRAVGIRLPLNIVPARKSPDSEPPWPPADWLTGALAPDYRGPGYLPGNGPRP